MGPISDIRQFLTAYWFRKWARALIFDYVPIPKMMSYCGSEQLLQTEEISIEIESYVGNSFKSYIRIWLSELFQCT